MKLAINVHHVSWYSVSEIKGRGHSEMKCMHPAQRCPSTYGCPSVVCHADRRCGIKTDLWNISPQLLYTTVIYAVPLLG